MFEMLRLLMKEEWRTHSSVFGGAMFSLFPVVIALFTFGFSLFIPMFETIITLETMYLGINYLGLLFGFTVGSFALLGREVMNRRFGHTSTIAYSSRTLPVSEKRIFFNVVLNDIIFYSVLYIIPFFTALSAASFFTGAMPVFQPFLIASVFLSFLMGLSASFFLSTVYVRSPKAFSFFMLAVFGALVAGGFAFSSGMLMMLPSFSFFVWQDIPSLAYSGILIIVPFSLSVAFAKIEFSEKVRHVRGRLLNLTGMLGRVFSDPVFVAKDMLDLSRSEGGIGKVFFSLIFPLVLIWAMLFIFSGLFALSDNALFLIFSVLVGALSSTMYNWLTEFDDFSSYSFLPMKASHVMAGKLKGYALLNISSLAVVIAASFLGNALFSLHFGLLVFFSLSAYTVSVTILLAGLKPNIVIYSAKTFSLYTLMISPVMILCIMVSMAAPVWLIAVPVALLPVSALILKKSFSKWDSEEL